MCMPIKEGGVSNLCFRKMGQWEFILKDTTTLQRATPIVDRNCDYLLDLSRLLIGPPQPLKEEAEIFLDFAGVKLSWAVILLINYIK